MCLLQPLSLSLTLFCNMNKGFPHSSLTNGFLGWNKVIFSYLSPFSLLVCSPSAYFVFVASSTCVFVRLLSLCVVLVCCRHSSPVHLFFSVFTAQNWASLSVCLPTLHPKIQLFIYKQLIRYCTELLMHHHGSCLFSFPLDWHWGVWRGYTGE